MHPFYAFTFSVADTPGLVQGLESFVKGIRFKILATSANSTLSARISFLDLTPALLH